MYSETITLFNRYHSRQGDIWYPHVLHKVDLIVDRASIIAKYGAEVADAAKLHIKYRKGANGIEIQGVPYLPHREWENLTNDKLGEYITFSADANYFDFFVIGKYVGGEEIVVPDEDTFPDEDFYPSEGIKAINDNDFFDGFYSFMEENAECYVITSASNPYKVIPHFELIAR